MPRNPFRRVRKHRYAAHQLAIPAVAESVKQLATKLDKWQARVLKYAEIVPEVMTGYLFVHNALDRVTFDIQRFDRAQAEWVADDSPEMQGIERRLNLAFKAGRAAALGHLIEETYILASRTSDKGFAFETLAPTEIESRGAVVKKRILVDGERHDWEVIPADTEIIRVYTPDPSDRHMASGPHKPLLGLLETMAIELLRDQADAISVLAGNGILYIPTEVLPDEVDSVDAAETPGSRKHFESLLEEAMVATITDRSKGEAVVPIVLYGPAEYADAIRHILPVRAETAKESTERMNGYISRYAKSIDLPEEVITGIGDSNHWSGWKVDENTWAYHLEPRAQRLADALYAGLVGRIIANLGHDPSEYRLHPNATAAIAKSDISRNAHEAYKIGAIEVEPYVEAIGFDPSDIRPDADELLLLTISGGGVTVEADGSRSLPDRTAAGAVTTRAILKQASKIANSQQRKLEALFRRVLSAIAEDAARDGKRAKKADKTAADVPFLGYDASRYFSKYADHIENATREELFTFLRRVATLTGQDYRTLRDVWATEFDQRARAVAAQAEKAAASVSLRSFDGAKAVRVSDNVVRVLSSTASGGSNETNGAAGNTQRPTHAGQDPVIRDSLTDSVGAYVTQYEWQVGEPAKPFPSHQDLDGRTWFSWEEMDALDVPSDESWLAGTTYFPGDHDGCQCSIDVSFLPMEEVA